MEDNMREEIDLVLRKDIYQSNPLIQARKDFDMVAIRIFLIGLCGLNPHFSENDKFFDTEFKEMFISTNKLVDLLGGNTWYLHDLEKVCDKMFRTVIKIRPDDGGFELYHLFRKLKYVPKEGLFIWFDDLLRPYILDLLQSGGYTRINVEYLFKLSSPYAVRLLELLLQYQNFKTFKEKMEIKRNLTVEEIRFVLNVPEGAYRDRMNNFRRFVLDIPIKEINTRTPYIVRYETVKKGRKVVAFEFIMYTYAVPKNDERNYTLKDTNDAIRTLCSLGFTERDARAIFAKCHDTADCFSRINRAQALLIRSKKPVENKLGFLREAIESDWQIGRKTNVESTRERRATKITEVARNVDSFNSSMTPIGQILKSSLSESLPDLSKNELPAKPKLLKLGKKEISYRLAEIFIKYIRKGEFLDSVKEYLRERNTTIEKFTKLCEKHGL